MSDFEFKLTPQAEEFFLFAYFGIVSKDLKIGEQNIQADSLESAAKKCAYRAYLDMCRTLTYQSGINDEKKQEFVLNICSEMAKRLLDRKNKTIKDKQNSAFSLFYDETELKETITKTFIERSEKDTEVFYYGQAQKWINMTLKYMYMIGALKGVKLKDLSVPLDSYIMQAASDDLKTKFPKKNSGEVGKYSISSSVPWSRLTKEQYEGIQTSIEHNCGKNTTGSEWECNAWIAQATLERIIEEKKKYKSEKEYARSNRLYSQNMKSSDKN